MRKAEFARFVGVSPSRVSQYVDRGLPVDFRGDIDLEVGLRWCRDNVRTLRFVSVFNTALPSVHLPTHIFDEMARIAVEGRDTA